MDGMKPEQQGRKRRRGQRPALGQALNRRVAVFPRHAEDLERQEKNQDRVEAVQKQVVQVVNHRVEAADLVIQGEGKPGKGDTVARVECGEHPLQGGQAEIADIWIFLDGFRIVPIHETVMEDRQVGQEDGQEQGQGEGTENKPVAPPKTGLWMGRGLEPRPGSKEGLPLEGTFPLSWLSKPISLGGCG